MSVPVQDRTIGAPSSAIVVLGSGVVGSRIARLLGDRPYRASSMRSVNLSDIAVGELVILAGGGAHAPLAEQLGRRGASVVSVSDELADVVELLALDQLFADHDATVVVGAAMAPGLSGLIARHLQSMLSSIDEIHTAFHATAGPQCARQHHRALAGRAVGWHDGDWIYRPSGSGRELCWFPEPVGARDCYRAELADPVVLQRDFAGVRRISARMSATRRDRLTSRLPMLRRPHPEGGTGAIRVEVRGADADGERRSLIAGIAEFVGAAAGATAVAMALAAARGDLPGGAITTSDERLDHRRLLGDISSLGIRLQEFTGVSGPA